jgi:hypothetical protein
VIETYLRNCVNLKLWFSTRTLTVIPLAIICTLFLYYSLVSVYLVILVFFLIQALIRSTGGIKTITQSIALLFGTLIFSQLILGIFQVSYYSNYFILITISFLSHSLFFYYVNKCTRGVFRSTLDLKLLIITSLPYLILIIYNLSLSRYDRLRWALSGWDHIGQHVAQITVLKSVDYFNYDVNIDPTSGNIASNMYPRALHSVIMFYLSIRRDKNTVSFISDAFAYLSYFELILIFLITLNLLGTLGYLYSLKPNYVRPWNIFLGSFLIGIIVLHDLFLSWFLAFGWSNSLFAAFIISAILLIYQTSQKHLFDLLAILLLNIMLVHTWPYFILFVFLNLTFFLYKFRDRFGLTRLFFILLVFFVPLYQIFFYTIKYFLSKSAVAHNNYTPGISSFVIIFLLGSFIFYLFICNFNHLSSILPYFFLLINFLLIYTIDDSRFKDLNYVASKFLQILLVISIPFFILFILYFGKKIGNLLFIPLLVVLVITSFTNSRQGVMQLIGKENMMGSIISLPSKEQVKFLMNFDFAKFLDKKVVFWNENGYDYSNSHWFMIGGIETINPVSANNVDRNTLCDFTSDDKKTLIISTKPTFIQEFKDFCKFNYEILMFK